MSDTIENQISVYAASKLFTYLCVRDTELFGFKLVQGKVIMMTTKGYYTVKMLQAASNFDSCLYVKFKGCIYKYNPDDKELPWSGVCHV